MAIQYSDLIRNARLDAIETATGACPALEIRTGAPPASASAAGSGSIIATIVPPADWMGNASSGSKQKAGTWSVASAGSGTAGHFRLYSQTGTKDGTTCVAQGTVGTSTCDLNLDNAVIATGQTVTINTFTLTDGNP